MIRRFGWAARVVGVAELSFVVRVEGIASEPYTTLVDADVWLDAEEYDAPLTVLPPSMQWNVRYLMASRDPDNALGLRESP